MLPVVLLPGLMAAGIGSLVFIGLGSWFGVQYRRLVAEPVPAAALRRPGLGRLRLDHRAGRRGRGRRLRGHGARPTRLTRSCDRTLRADDRRRDWPSAASRSRSRRRPATRRTRCSSRARTRSRRCSLGAATISLSTLALLIVFKGLAWSISLEQLPRRPDVPGDLPRRRRRAARGAPPRLLRDARRRGPRRRRAASPSCGCRLPR